MSHSISCISQLRKGNLYIKLNEHDNNQIDFPEILPPFEGVDTWKQDISNKDDYVWEPAENAVFKTVGKTPVDPTESTKRIKQQMQDLKKRLGVIKQK